MRRSALARLTLQNCVGQANYGHFVRFLFYVDVCTAMHLWLISSLAFGTRSYYLREPSSQWLVILIMNYVLCVPVVVAVGLFSLYHFYCLAANQTSASACSSHLADGRSDRGVREGQGRHAPSTRSHPRCAPPRCLLILTPRQVKYPYDLGFVRNIASVLGQRTLWWCWPQRMQGDGLSFPTSAGVGKWLDAQSAGRVSSIEASDAV